MGEENMVKLAILEKELEAELAKVVGPVKGCFGTLLMSADNEHCKACPELEPCKVEMEVNRPGLLEAAESKVTDETLKVELGVEWDGIAELKKMFENPPERKTELLEAPKAIEAPVEAVEPGALDLDALKGATRLTVNWTKLVGAVLAERPKNINGVALLVQKETGASKAARTNMAKGILQAMNKQGVVRLHDTFRTWRYEWL